jgi:hypothetical protein
VRFRSACRAAIRLRETAGAELPWPREVTEKFGRYQAEFISEDGGIRYQRNLVLKAATLPPEKAALLRKFLVEVARAERSSVVLRRNTK